MPLGVHFAITDEQRQKLEACKTDDERKECVQEEIEEEWDKAFLVETDKAWDAIHRSLGEFPPNVQCFYEDDWSHGEKWAAPEDYGSPPLKLAVLGGKKLMDWEGNHFIRLIEPGEVSQIAAALIDIDEAELRRRYFKHCEGAWPEYGEEDFEYT